MNATNTVLPGELRFGKTPRQYQVNEGSTVQYTAKEGKSEHPYGRRRLARKS
jgi:hypothetical protein